MAPDPIPIPPDPLPPNGRLSNGAWSILAILAIATIGYYLVFGFALPDFGTGAPGQRDTTTNTITVPGCKYQRGISRVISSQLIICNNGAVVTITETR